MKPIWWNIRKGDAAAVVLAAVILSALLFAAVKSPGGWPLFNGGFGPDWDCSNPGEGGVVCIKKAPAVPTATP